MAGVGAEEERKGVENQGCTLISCYKFTQHANRHRMQVYNINHKQK